MSDEYPEDEPCPSALMLGFLENTPYHVVIAQCEDHMRIVTVYYPKEPGPLFTTCLWLLNGSDLSIRHC